MKWEINQNHSQRVGLRYNLKLADRWGRPRIQRTFRRAGLRRLADALQDGADGFHGQVHEWAVLQSAADTDRMTVSGEKFRISITADDAANLIRRIDNLLGD